MDTPPPVPKRRQGMAITSFVLGVLGNVCLGPLAGIPAIITGHIAYHRSRRWPDRYAAGNLAVAGFVLGYVSLLVGTAMIAILAALALPAVARARQSQSVANQKTQEARCLNNLQMLGAAARSYANDHQDTFPPDLAAIGPSLRDPNYFVCPADSAHTPLPGNNWSELADGHVSYEYLAPGREQGEVLNEELFRCRIHPHALLGDGSIRIGRLQ